MNENYRTFFGLTKDPFGTDISMSEILKTPELIDIKDRFDYVIRLGAIGLVTGEVGSGKSTALRYALEKLHPSEYRTLYITASSGSIMEFYRQFVEALDLHLSSNSKVIMVRMKWFNNNGHHAKNNYQESEVFDERKAKTSTLHKRVQTRCCPARH